MTRGRRTAGGEAAGFTLIELLIVLVVIAVLAAIVQPRLVSAVHQAREAALAQDLAVLRDALDQHYADTGRYPESLAVLVERRYVRRVPKDPMTGSADTWQLVFDLDAAGAPRGVFDVRSGSDGTGSDGRPYGEW